MRHHTHQADLCVVGGGLAGLCAAVAAARHGARVVLMHDRPMLGGNASSEVRMWVCGAHGRDLRETGIVDEILLDNVARNPAGVYSIWDSVLYETARFQPNLTLLLNCSCCELRKDGERIASVRGWQTTAQTWHTVEAALFADCSGDSILAPLSGAEFRVGREAEAEFGESIEPAEADRKTMGMSCLIQARETDRPHVFEPPAWARVFAGDADLPHRGHDILKTNYWWLELGGEQDSIYDTEVVRDELLAIAFGVWDHIKNRGDHQAANWVLDWVGFVPGKRESRRYVGDHVLTQNDVRAEGRFDDLVAYGGWSMDDHHPAGIRYPGPPTIFHPAPSPFGIPYRSLYSRNVPNLLFAGRNISCTHAAMSSTRVMATCATLGQAAGTAAAIAAGAGLTPGGVREHRLAELQQTLMDDDCYLPWHVREVPALTRRARLTASAGDPEPLRNGVDRPVGAVDNAWTGVPGAWVQYAFDAAVPVRELRLVFDSHLSNDTYALKMPCCYPLGAPDKVVPASLVRDFRVEAMDGEGHWGVLARVAGNHRRLVRVPVTGTVPALRLVVERTWGAAACRVFALDVC